jgi:hypothetical protein
MNPQLEDLANAPHRTTLGPAGVKAVLASIKRYGVAIVKGAFNPALIEVLLANAEAHGALVEKSLRQGIPLTFAPHYGFLERSLAGNLAAIDPAAADGSRDEFTRTTLHDAMMTPLMRSTLITLLGANSGWAVARTRVVIPGLEGVNGGLALHLEKTAVRFPGAYNLWTSLTPPGVTTNADAPGLQLFIGRLAFFESAPESEIADCVAELSQKSREEAPLPTVDGFFYRPRLRAGDVAIFSGAVPHGSFIPTAAVRMRVGFDVRVFPWTSENLLPEGSIQMGQRPRPLIWSDPRVPVPSG